MDNKKLNNLHRIKRHLVCDDETYQMITVDCRREYLKHHPEMLGSNITQKHILHQLAKFYLEQF